MNQENLTNESPDLCPHGNFQGACEACLREKYDRLTPELFVHNPDHPEQTEQLIDQLLEIERLRFPEDQAFEREEFERALLNTAPNEENKGKTTTVVLVKDPVDHSIFGFTYADPADTYYSASEDPSENFHPERLSNPNVAQTAYITDTVFRESGSGVLRKVMSELEKQLFDKGYRFLERDSTTTQNYADNLVKNNQDRVIYTESHDSEFGPQMFIRMKLEKTE